MIDRNIAFENLMADEPPARDVLIKNLWMIVGAYIILHFNVGFSFTNWSLPLLPSSFGWVWLFHVTRTLRDRRPTLRLLTTPTIVLAFFSFFQSAPTVGEQLTAAIPILSLFISIVTIYVHFQFLTDVASMLEEEGCVQYSKKILRCRTYIVVLITCSDLVVRSTTFFDGSFVNVIEFVMPPFLFVQLGVIFLLISYFVRSIKFLRHSTDEQVDISDTQP